MIKPKSNTTTETTITTTINTRPKRSKTGGSASSIAAKFEPIAKENKWCINDLLSFISRIDSEKLEIGQKISMKK